jgi:hypothetical protein
MVLGVAVPVARFIGRLTADPIVDVDDDRRIDPGASLLVVGRQRLLDDGTTRIGGDVLLEQAARLPRRVVYVVPDRVAVGRYAADRQAWRTVAASGRRVMILEVGLLRELGEDDAVLKARTVFEADGAGVVGLIDGRVIE